VSERTEVGLNCLPLKTKGFRLFRWAGLALSLAFCGLSPAQAQNRIISIVDEGGKRIYIDWAPPQPPSKAATKGTPAKGGTSTAAAVPADPSRARRYTKTDVDRIVQIAAERHKVDPALVRAVIEHESGWNPQAVSRAGAQGLMQLMPATAEEHGVGNAFDPEQNINAGVRHLRKLLERYNGDLDKALAAYNAGEGAVRRAGGVPNIPETRTYVQKVTNTYFHPGSGRAASPVEMTRSIYKTVDARGKVIYTNE
jgi:soluble lytic murein transglycosylase-like protein